MPADPNGFVPHPAADQHDWTSPARPRDSGVGSPFRCTAGLPDWTNAGATADLAPRRLALLGQPGPLRRRGRTLSARGEEGREGREFRSCRSCRIRNGSGTSDRADKLLAKPRAPHSATPEILQLLNSDVFEVAEGLRDPEEMYYHRDQRHGVRKIGKFL